MLDTTPGLFTPPSRDTARAVLPRVEHTEQQPKLLILQTIHFYSPKCSTSSFWQERDSWLKAVKKSQAGQNCHSFSLVQAEEEERSAPQNSQPSGRASPLPHFYSATVPVYGWRTGSWPATTEVPSNVLLCILSAKDYFCAKQETDQPLCQEQQIPCSLSSLPSLPKVQTRSLCIFTHTHQSGQVHLF